MASKDHTKQLCNKGLGRYTSHEGFKMISKVLRCPQISPSLRSGKCMAPTSSLAKSRHPSELGGRFRRHLFREAIRNQKDQQRKMCIIQQHQRHCTDLAWRKEISQKGPSAMPHKAYTKTTWRICSKLAENVVDETKVDILVWMLTRPIIKTTHTKNVQ